MVHRLPGLIRRLAPEAWAATVLALLPTTADAQVEIDIAPALGGYASFTSFASPPDPILFDQTYPVSQGTGVALGGHVTVWPGSRLGVRAYAATSASSRGPTNHAIITNILIREAIPARVTLAGAELVLPVSRIVNGTTIHVAGGAGMIRRSGEAYEGHEGTTDLTGTAAVGSRVPLGDRLGLQLDARALVYGLALTDEDGDAYGNATQTDILAQIGLTWRLGSRDDW